MKRLDSLLTKYITIFDEEYREQLEVPYSALRALAIALSIDQGYITMYLLVPFTLFTATRDTLKMGRVPNWVLHTCGFLLVYVGMKIWLLHYGG